MKRREFITVLGGAAALWPLPLVAQQPPRPFQIGFVYPGPQAAAPSRIAAFLSGLQAGGIRPEQVTIIPRVTGGDSALLAPMADDLVGLKVDLISAVSPAAIKAAQAATRTIPGERSGCQWLRRQQRAARRQHHRNVSRLPRLQQEMAGSVEGGCPAGLYSGSLLGPGDRPSSVEGRRDGGRQNSGCEARIGGSAGTCRCRARVRPT